VFFYSPYTLVMGYHWRYENSEISLAT
jgi:hypothetical protein